MVNPKLLQKKRNKNRTKTSSVDGNARETFMRQQKEVTENQRMQIKAWTRGHKGRKSRKQQVRSELATQVDSKANGDFKI